MTTPPDRAWDPGHRDGRAAPGTARHSPWRWYLRTHFTRPGPRPAGVVVGSLALTVAGLLNVISLMAIAATWRSRFQQGLDPRVARDLYDLGRFAVFPAVIALMIVGIPVLSRLLRWWVLAVQALILTAALLGLTVSAPSL